MGPAALTAGAGLASGLLGNNKGAQHAADSAASDRSKLAARASALFDKQFSTVEGADQNGQFNPSTRIASMESEGGKALGVAERAASADAMDAGYHSGDTAVQQAKDNIKLKFAQGIAAGKDSLTQDAFNDKLKAYDSVNAGNLQPGIQADNIDQQVAMSRFQNPANLISGAISAWPRGRTTGINGGYGAGGYAPGSPGMTGAGSNPWDVNWNNYFSKQQ